MVFGFGYCIIREMSCTLLHTKNYYMPVKIVADNMATNNSSGVINKKDLQKIKEDFIKEVELVPTGGRTKVNKRFSCYVFKSQFQQLFNQYPDSTMLKINFGVQLENIVDCNDRDCSDDLTIVIEAAKEGVDTAEIEIFSNEEDFVIIPSFRSDSRFAMPGGPCCPSGHP